MQVIFSAAVGTLNTFEALSMLVFLTLTALTASELILYPHPVIFALFDAFNEK